MTEIEFKKLNESERVERLFMNLYLQMVSLKEQGFDPLEVINEKWLSMFKMPMKQYIPEVSMRLGINEADFNMLLSCGFKSSEWQTCRNNI